MGFQTKLAVGLASLSTALSLAAQQPAAAPQPCDTSFINARDVAAQLKSVGSDQWNKAFIAQLGTQTRDEIKRFAAQDSHKLTLRDEGIFRQIEQVQLHANAGRVTRTLDIDRLMAQASPGVKKILPDVIEGKKSVTEGRQDATLATIELSKQFISNFDAIVSSGCLSPLTVQPVEENRVRRRTNDSPRPTVR